MSLVLLNRLLLYSFRQIDLASRYGGNPTRRQRQDAVRQLWRRFCRCLGSRARQSGSEQFENPSKEDIDGVLLTIRYVERRLLDRFENT